MKTNKIKPIKILRRNLKEIIFVFLAFAMMAAAAYFSVGNILRNRLLDRAKEMISSAEANIRVGLSEAETILLNSHIVIQDMIEHKASMQEMLDYLINTTKRIRELEHGMLGYYGIYGFINEEFYDSIGLNPGSDYIPQTRPWYQTAARSGKAVGYTTPYIDLRTGDTVVSAVRNIFDKDDRIIGILTIDIIITWLAEYVSSLSPASGGYGILINQNMTIMSHPDNKYVGLQLQELDGNYYEIAGILRSDQKLFAHRTKGRNSAIVFFTQIFNGWFVGIVSPYHQFYRDIYTVALILILLGLVLSLLLCYMLLRLSAAKMRADEESKSKSSFLASMSHEIRTPLNAINGMVELLLRGNLSDESQRYAQDIKQAGGNLISIINDILDISKIEAGKMEIISAKYLFSSLINDTVNIVRMRVGAKPVRFFTNIDSSIPAGLLGDEVRLRQMLINLLANAIKYTERGSIGLHITVEKREEKHVWLRFTVTDTGKGIKLEDQADLFNEFVQVDKVKNRNIEGTGLGLAITKRMCIAMNGDITLESEYGKGSSFTMIIPQGIESTDSIAMVEKPEKKKILIFERRIVLVNSMCWSLENMRIPYLIVTNQTDLAEALHREEWFYIFSGYGLYEKIKPLMDQNFKNFPPLALTVESGTENYIPNVRFVFLPIQCLSIANILNGKTDTKGCTENTGIIKYSFPHTRLLVVDDIETNLRVAEGLLAPYKSVIDTCTSGEQAVELVKQQKYDLVFMDHMMPDMDGIEATMQIREWNKQLPIIALTANAVAGMREMFIDKGFSDYLAKPIDVLKLDEIINTWMPKAKKECENISDNSMNSQYPAPSQELSIPGVNIQSGIARTGGSTENYIAVLSMFRKDAEERLPLFKTAPNKDTLPSFITQVHALKSAAASIGAEKISTKAAELEAAANAENYSVYNEDLNEFAAELADLIEGIKKANIAYKVNLPGKPDENTSLYIEPLLLKLAGALKAKKASSDILNIIDKLNTLPLTPEHKEIPEKISFLVLMNEYDEAVALTDKLIVDYKKVAI